MKPLFLILFLSLGFGWQPASGQGSPSAPALTASIKPKNGQILSSILVGCDSSTLHVTTPTGQGVVGIPLDSLEGFRISSPLPQDADPNTIILLLPYLNVPGSNVSELLFRYGRIMHESGKLQREADLYQSMQQRAKSARLQQESGAALAYVLQALGKASDSEEIFKKLQPLEKSDPIFALEKIGRGKLLLGKKKYRAALDQFSQAVVYFHRDEPWYPEAEFYLAESYSGLASEIRSTNETESSVYAEAAQTTYAGVFRFYPGTLWAKNAKEQLVKIPIPVTTEPPADKAKSADVPDETPSPTPEEEPVKMN